MLLLLRLLLGPLKNPPLTFQNVCTVFPVVFADVSASVCAAFAAVAHVCAAAVVAFGASFADPVGAFFMFCCCLVLFVLLFIQVAAACAASVVCAFCCFLLLLLPLLLLLLLRLLLGRRPLNLAAFDLPKCQEEFFN